MGRLLGKLLALFAYFCVATCVTAAAGVAYWRASGKLDDERVKRIVAAAQGIDLAAPAKEVKKEENPDREEPSFEELEEARELKARNLEVREHSLKSGLDRIRFEKDKLTEEKDRYTRLKSTFEEELEILHRGAVSSGKESVRLIWENIKPKQAKEQIMQMLDAGEMSDVVTILAAMPIARRAKIIGEFKSPDEAEKLGEVLRLIRQGVPQVNLIERTQEQVKQP